MGSRLHTILVTVDRIFLENVCSFTTHKGQQHCPNSTTNSYRLSGKSRVSQTLYPKRRENKLPYSTTADPVEQQIKVIRKMSSRRLLDMQLLIRDQLKLDMHIYIYIYNACMYVALSCKTKLFKIRNDRSHW